MRRAASIEKIDDLFLSRASRDKDDNHRYKLKNRITYTDSFRLVNDRHFHHFTDSIIRASDNLVTIYYPFVEKTNFIPLFLLRRIETITRSPLRRKTFIPKT